jgi:response regulator RpfG family c-di-GMP phosphodiesterase
LFTGYADLRAATPAINPGNVYRYITKPWDPAGLPTVIREACDRYDLLVERQQLLMEVRAKNEELEKANPGITKIEMDEDGAIMMDDSEGGAEDVQSLLDDLEREMAKVARR